MATDAMKTRQARRMSRRRTSARGLAAVGAGSSSCSPAGSSWPTRDHSGKIATVAAMIAALYLALTLLFQPISFGAVQFRISEAMTLLPAIFPEATIGLTLGCFLSNFLAGANVYDVVFGTLATLLAALISWRVGKKKLWYAAIPPVVCNGVIVGLVLTYAYQIPALWMNMLTVAAGEAVVCFALGVPLVRFLNKHKDKLL